MKVLFITKKRNNTYGISVGLLNSAVFVANALHKHIGIETKITSVIDGNCIDREVFNYKPDNVVIEALWVTPDKIDELVKLHPKINWSIRIHSKTPFLANEGVAMDWLDGYKAIAKHHRNLHISANNLDFCVDITEATKLPIKYLPNIYEPELEKIKRHIKCNSEFIDIGCFGAIRPLKNHLEQAVAAIIFSELIGRKVRFHINAERVEQRGEEVLKNLRGLFKTSNGHMLIEHEWTPHKEFLNLIGSMDINMQVSMSESFNIVTADSIYQDVPVVVSDDVDWVPSMFRASPTDTNDIISKLRVAWAARHLTRINRVALSWYNIKSLQIWTKYLFGKQFHTSKGTNHIKRKK